MNAKTPVRPLRALVIALLGFVALTAACTSLDAIGDTAPPAPNSKGAGVSTVHSIKPGILPRTYRLYIPPSLPSGRKVPLVVALHGGAGSGSIMEDMTHFDVEADKRGFVVAYPDGYKGSWNAGTCCDPAMKYQVRDVDFVRAVIQDAEKNAPIDPARVYGTGFSNGSMLLHRIACDAPDTFAAIAAVSGGPMFKDCNAKRGVPTLLVQGRADPRIPWDGGVFLKTYRPSIKEIVTSLKTRNQCSGAEAAGEKTEVAHCTVVQGCSAGEVEWCELVGMGHQWAGGRTFLPSLLGPNTDKFDTTAEVTAFFLKH